MGSDLVGNQSLANVFRIGKPEMLLRCDIAKHCCAMPASDGSTNRRCDVVITRRNISNQGAKNIEGGFIALLHLLLHVELNLIQRHMAWTLHHHLNVMLPSTAG